MQRLLHELRTDRPHVVACLGYALFLATNATVIWGGVFPFLPAEFQTPDIVTAFFITQSIVFTLCYFLSAFGSYFFPGPAKRFLVGAAALPYFLGWCCLIAAIYLPQIALTLCYLGGGLIGFGTAGFFMVWQRLFAAQKATAGNRDLLVGTFLAPFIYFALYLIPIAVTSFLMPLVFMPLFALCITLTSRTVNLDQPMFDDIPREHPKAYRLVLADYWRSAVCVGSLAFSCGIVRALSLPTPAAGALINITSMAALLAGAGFLLLVWQAKALRLNISLIFLALFPFVVSGFLLLPVLGETYLRAFSGILHAIYSCAIVLIMIQCAQAARDRGINPVFVYGFVAGVVYALHDVGYLLGAYLEGRTLFGLDPLAAVTLVSLYLLGIMFFIGQGGFRSALSPTHAKVDRVELIPTAGNQLRNRPSAGPVQSAPAQASRADESPYRDRLSKQCALVQKHFKLSEREAEIIERIARGSTVAGVAASLGVTDNTVRTHMKRIYAKLDIHKKQELLDLVGTFDPRALTDNNTSAEQ